MTGPNHNGPSLYSAAIWYKAAETRAYEDDLLVVYEVGGLKQGMLPRLHYVFSAN